MTFKKIVFIFSCMIMMIHSHAQIDSTNVAKPRTWDIIKNDGRDAFLGAKNCLTEPLRWKQNDFINAGIIVAGTGLAYAIDEQAQEYFLDQAPNSPQLAREFGWYFGKPQNFFPVSAGLYGTGLLIKNEKVRRTGVLIFTSSAVVGLIQTVTKTVIGRARPQAEKGKAEFDPFNNDGAYHSFPSGHAMLSFTMAHAAARQFDNLWIKMGLYGAGLVAPVSRLWANAHWLSDVVLGMAISFVVVNNIDNYLKKQEQKDPSAFAKPKLVKWNLSAGAGKIGIVGTF